VISVATNIDNEHLAFFGSFGKLEEAFAKFLGSIPFYGVAVICGDDPVLSAIADRLQKRVIRYGIGPNLDIRAENIKIGGGITVFDVLQGVTRLGTVKLPILGTHMVLNALAAIAVGLEIEAPFEKIRKGLESFAGVARRGELLAEINGVRVIDDYGHHPREISATLSAVRAGHLYQGASGKLRVIFQPHRYSRTKELLSDFLTCFADADELYISDIYAADEDPIAGISGDILAKTVVHSSAHYTPDLHQTVCDVVSSATPGDIVVTMGAGSISSVARKALDELHQTGRVANI
jgi:UDP-N-acetylmuramate--alanine ligase